MASTNQAISVCLDENNYHIWLFLMQHYLRGRGLLKFVDGSCPCPQFQIADDGTLSHDNNGAYEKWLEQDSFVISLITTTLSADALTLVVGCGTSMEVWLTLRQRYATVSDFHIMQLKSSLQSIQKGSDSVEKYLLRFKSVRDQLAVLGVRISDQDVRALILAGLPNVYGHTRQIIRSKNNIDLEDVRYLLLSAEAEIELQNKAFPLSSLTAMAAYNGLFYHTPQNFQFGMNTVAQNKSLASYMNSLQVSSSLLPSINGIPHSSVVAPNVSNVDHFNATPSAGTTQFGFVPPLAMNTGYQSAYSNVPSPSSIAHFGIQQCSMPSSTILDVPDVHSQCGDMLSFSTNINVPYSMPYSGFMLNNNVGNGSCFSSPTPSSEFAPQTGGFPNQNGGLKVQNVDYTSASQFNCSQQGFSANNGVYSNMPQQQGSLSQATSNSCFNGGYTEHIVAGHELEELNTKEVGRTPEVCTLFEQGLENASRSSKEMEATFEASKRSQNVTETSKIDDAFVTEYGKFHKGGVRPLKTYEAGLETKPKSFISPKALSASISTQPKLVSIATQSNRNASQSQVKPLQVAPASSLPLKAIVALPTSDILLHSYTQDRNLMNCGQACASTVLWKSRPLIPPG